MGVERTSRKEKPKSIFGALFKKENPKERSKRLDVKKRRIRAKIKIKEGTRQQLGNLASKAKRSYELVGRGGVLQAQKKLRKLGYLKSAADGIYGPKTYQAVTRFQNDNGLTPDGVIGKKTLSAFKKNRKGRKLKYEKKERRSSKESVKNLEGIPTRWKGTFNKLVRNARNSRERNDILSRKYPITLGKVGSSASNGRGLFIMGNEVIEFPVVTGSGIIRDLRRTIKRRGKKIKNPNYRKIIKRSPPVKSGYSQNDHSTNVNCVYRFNSAANRKNGGKKIMSPEATSYGKKWWHYVPPKQKATWGCWGIRSLSVSKKIAKYVQKTGKGFGFGVS